MARLKHPAPPAVLFALALALFGWGFVEVVEVGTCASGGPYAIQTPCPEGSGGKFWLTFGGGLLLTVALIWMGVQDYWRCMAGLGIGSVVLGGLFFAAEAVPVGNGIEGVGWFLGPLFWILGVPGLVVAARMLSGRWQAPRQPGVGPAWDAFMGRSRRASADASGRPGSRPSDTAR